MARTELVRRLNANDLDFPNELRELLSFSDVGQDVSAVVSDIIAEVKATGDAALIQYTKKFDRLKDITISDLCVSQEQLQQALSDISDEQKSALQQAAERIKSYHRHQLAKPCCYEDDEGTMLGQQITALDRVGLYVPGGKASYPSSVLMNAIPAKVAGVVEVVITVPTPDGVVNPLVMAAAAIAEVDKVFTVGGAQAIAAMAYGTETIPRVDKIVGPGNVFVAEAKKQVFGQVAIDMLAGPSEILVICDGKTDPDWIAMDLFSQAEHDENAQSILISPDTEFLSRVSQSIETLLPTLQRQAIARQSLQSRGALIEVTSIEQAIDLANRIAPEHLELSVDDPERYLPLIKHAGAIFLGRHTAEALGDYCAGPNHVLPTSGTARFSSPLGVYDFQKRSSIIYCSPQTASEMGKVASVLARSEGLEAHARSAEYRIKKQ